MGYLLLCMICNVLLGIVFRYFRKYEVYHLSAIVINYAVCTAIALSLSDRALDVFQTIPEWWPFALVVGALLMFGFWIIASTIHYYGIGATSVFQKTSLLVTAIFAIWYFNEPAVWSKLIGIPLAVISIYLIHRSAPPALDQLPIWVWLLPVLTFLFNASIDTLLMYVEETGVVRAGDTVFIAALFLVAGLIGLLSGLIRWWQGHLKLGRREWLGGIALGVPNFLSVHFFLLALSGTWGGSVIVPLNNVGIILLSALAGWYLFKEAMAKRKLVGISLAIVAILLISLS